MTCQLCRLALEPEPGVAHAAVKAHRECVLRHRQGALILERAKR